MYKVLYVSPNGYLGGAERFVVSAALGHKKNKKVEASILFFSSGEALREAQSAGVETFVLNSSFRMRSPFKFLRALFEIRKIVRHFRPDALHLTMPYSHIVLSLATLGMGIKKVWFQHGPVGGRLDQIANFFPVEMIWYNSEDLKFRHHKTWPAPTVKMSESIINLGVPQSDKVHHLFTDPILKIGTAGRICSWKGFHHIIIALAELKKERVLSSFQFSIAGDAKTPQDKIYEAELISLAKRHDLSAEIVFLKHVEKMENFYQTLDLFIHASVIPEPFGLVVAEAMANGCLVIGSDEGGVRDMLKNGVTGLTFPAASSDAVSELKKVLSKILEMNAQDIDQLRLMASQGKVFVEKNYNLETMILSIEDLYFQLKE